MQTFGSCGDQVERKPKMAGDQNEKAIWAFVLSLLVLITTLQQNYYNKSAHGSAKRNGRPLLRGYPLNDPPQSLSSLTIPYTFRRLLRRQGLINVVLRSSWY